MKKNSINGQFNFHPSLSEWHDAVAMLPSDISVTPFVGKCLYFVGVTRHVIDAASRLYKHEYNLPALLLASTVVELFGRCIRGDETHFRGDKERLKTGFQKIVEVSFPHKPKNDLNVYTSDTQSYSQDDLIALRNFGAHGFSGTYLPNLQIDRLFIGWLFGAIGEALNCYFEELQNSEDVAKRMAQAGISPLIFQESESVRRPIHIRKIYEFLRKSEEPKPKPGKFAFEEYWHKEYLEVKSLNQPPS